MGRALKSVLVALSLAAAALVPPAAASAPAGPNLEPFRGLGAWVDIFEDRAWRNPAKTIADMAGHGVRTLYLQTSNYSQDLPIAHREGVAAFLAAAHRRDMDVVAWYLPGFAKLPRDFQRSMAAINFRSASGQRFDAFGLDIEASILGPPSERTKRLLRLSRRIRERAGSDYPLGAVIPSPVGIELNKGYWPNFPYAGLSDLYDAFVPMGYFTYHVNGPVKVHDETSRNVAIIREETGDPTIPIHLIGGVADDASGSEVQAFVHAVREHGLLGASIYNWSLTGAPDWTPLETIPTNPRQTPALPLPMPFAGAVGNIQGEDRTHPKEVVYGTGPLAGPRALSFEAFDIQADEVHVWVNWKHLVQLPPSSGWSAAQEMAIPDELLLDARDNVIAFVAAGEHPDWSEWGVRAVSLS
ncbi:MAG: hypothetical protein ACRDHM_02075 [Actinomycetota bacterium]